MCPLCTEYEVAKQKAACRPRKEDNHNSHLSHLCLLEGYPVLILAADRENLADVQRGVFAFGFSYLFSQLEKAFLVRGASGGIFSSEQIAGLLLLACDSYHTKQLGRIGEKISARLRTLGPSNKVGDEVLGARGSS